MCVKMCVMLFKMWKLLFELDGQTGSRFPSGPHEEKCQLNSDKNMKTESLRLDL